MELHHSLVFFSLIRNVANMIKNTRLIILFSLFLSLAYTGKAQEEFIEPPSKLVSSFPFFQLTGGIVILNGQIDEHPDTLNFILDSGSSGISLDSTTASELKLVPEPSDKTIRGIAGIKKVGFLYDRVLTLPGMKIRELDFHVNDYSILTAVYGIRIDGIIGYSVLSRYIVKIDYDSLKIEFWTRGTMKYPRGGYLFKPILTTLPVQFGRVKDGTTRTTRFLHDIGAGVCLMLSRDFVEDSTILHRKRKLYAKEGEGVGGKIDMHLSVVKEFKLGPYKFRNVPTYIFEDEYNVTSYPYLGGIIGNDLLRRFNAIINYEKRDIHLTPNSHYKDPFDYSYCGIELYLIEGQIEVGDVAKGSPAEAAGLKEQDIVVAINNNFSQNLNQYKIALQAPNEKVRMIVRRDGELQMIEFRVKHIL